MNLKELIERQQALLDGAKNAGREMNDEEKREFDDLQGKIDALKVAENTKDTAREAVEAERRRVSEITALCRSAVNKMLGFSLKHIGINCENDGEALDTASKFAEMFGWEQKVGNSSVFAGSAVECMKSPFKGSKGHIAVETNSVRRAVYQLAHKGIEADMSTAKYDADGIMTVVYLKDERGGFAVHLTEKK